MFHFTLLYYVNPRYNVNFKYLRNSLTDAFVYTADTVSERKLSPKDALKRRNGIYCVYNYRNFIVSQLLNINFSERSSC